MKQHKTYRLRSLTTILFFMVSLFPIHAAENDSISYFTNIAGKFNHVFPQEKLYLHLDNTGYFIGETLWFKVYQVCSNNLIGRYVEWQTDRIPFFSIKLTLQLYINIIASEFRLNVFFCFIEFYNLLYKPLTRSE